MQKRVVFLLLGCLLSLYFPLVSTAALPSAELPIPPEAIEQAKGWGFSMPQLTTIGEFLQQAPGELADRFGEIFTTQVRALGRQGMAIFSTILLLALLHTLEPTGGGQIILGLLASLSVGGVLLPPLLTVTRHAQQAITAAGGFLLSFAPLYAGMVAAGGAPVSAAASQSMLLILAQFLSSFGGIVLLPALQCYLILVVAAGISRETALTSLAAALRKLVGQALIWGVSGFSALLGLRKLLGGAADGIALQTAQLLTGSWIPLVGSAISEAMGAVGASLRLLRGSVGILGIIVLLFLFLPPLLPILLLRGLCFGAVCMAEGLSVGGVLPILRGLGDFLAVLQAFLLAAAVLLLLSVGVLLSGGGGIG